VNFNYRVNAFGWLAGKEALAGGAANIGLYDREYRFCDQRIPVGNDLQLNAGDLGSTRKVLPGLGSDLHLRVRW